MTKQLIEVSPKMTQACLDAIAVWGQSAQLIQSMGECAEYTAEVVRFFQGRDPEMSNIVEEAADVMILMMQIRELVGAEKFDSALQKKFEKFSGKIQSARHG